MISDNMKAYHNKILETLDAIMSEEIEKIETAAEIITDCMIRGNLLYVLGTGHSMTIVQEMFGRAGGLIQVNGILDPALSPLFLQKSLETERLSGYSKIILDYYGLTKADVLLVVSVSGVNAVPVEAAVEARNIGSYVVGLTSVSWSRKLQPRNKYDKRLCEAADLVINNHVPFGDAVIRMTNSDKMVSPISTLVNSFIVNLLVTGVADNYARRHLEPPVWTSANIPGGDDIDAPYVEKYRFSKLRHF